MPARPHALLAIPTSLTSSLVVNATASSTSPPHTTSRTHSRLRYSRRYATVTDQSGGTEEERHVWPDAPKGHSCPTPYQILCTTRKETYSKAHFYNLVKLYHPDRGSLSTVGTSIPHQVRLERYRLIVAAHNILSDPSKRSAYDRLGLGWQGRPDFNKAAASTGAAGPFNDNLHADNNPIWQNATWEDWEAFHDRRKARESGMPEAQEPLFLSNTTFIGLVFVIIFCGSAMNYGRAQNNGDYFVEQRDIIHDRAAKELRRVKVEKQTMGNRGDRVEWFVRQRDATLGSSIEEKEAMRDELADRLLPQDVCRSDSLAAVARQSEDG